MAEPVDTATAFIRDAPFEVLKALLGRLSPKGILRMFAVSKVWRASLRSGPLLHRLYLLEPPRPLLCFDHAACPDRYLGLRDYGVESLDLRSDKLRSVFRFTDNEGYDFDEYDLEGRGRRGAPAIDEFRVDYTRMENHGQVVLKPQLRVHGSLDGHLLVSSLDGWHVVNPVTRRWVQLPNLSRFNVIAFYHYNHVPAAGGEYRVLCFCPGESPAVYGILTVTTVQLRLIGCPISPAAATDHGLALGVDAATMSPPVKFRRNFRLHWPPQRRQGFHMLVFDIMAEQFSWKRPPPVIDQDMRLLEFPNGDLGLSVSGVNEAALDLWRLQDYYDEVWVPQYRIQLLLPQMPVLQEEGAIWMAAVVSPEGDVLIQSTTGWLLHCDRNGNLLRQFRFPGRLFAVRHALKESLLPHPMFWAPKIEGAAEPSFFNGLSE